MLPEQPRRLDYGSPHDCDIARDNVDGVGRDIHIAGSSNRSITECTGNPSDLGNNVCGRYERVVSVVVSDEFKEILRVGNASIVDGRGYPTAFARTDLSRYPD